MQVLHWNTKQDGKLDEDALRRTMEAAGYTVIRNVYEPGVSAPAHLHGVEKMDGVVSGRFRVELNGESTVLEPGDRVVLPEGAVHAVSVAGNEPVVSLNGVRRSWS